MEGKREGCKVGGTLMGVGSVPETRPASDAFGCSDLCILGWGFFFLLKCFQSLIFQLVSQLLKEALFLVMSGTVPNDLKLCIVYCRHATFQWLDDSLCQNISIVSCSWPMLLKCAATRGVSPGTWLTTSLKLQRMSPRGARGLECPLWGTSSGTDTTPPSEEGRQALNTFKHVPDLPAEPHPRKPQPEPQPPGHGLSPPSWPLMENFSPLLSPACFPPPCPVPSGNR